MSLRVQLKVRVATNRVRTASGSDRILRATQHKYLFRKLLFDPVATARGSDTTLIGVLPVVQLSFFIAPYLSQTQRVDFDLTRIRVTALFKSVREIFSATEITA